VTPARAPRPRPGDAGSVKRVLIRAGHWHVKKEATPRTTPRAETTGGTDGTASPSTAARTGGTGRGSRRCSRSSRTRAGNSRDQSPGAARSTGDSGSALGPPVRHLAPTRCLRAAPARSSRRAWPGGRPALKPKDPMPYQLIPGSLSRPCPRTPAWVDGQGRGWDRWARAPVQVRSERYSRLRASWRDHGPGARARGLLSGRA